MTFIDGLALLVVVLAALAGFRKGLVAGALSVIGILLGAWLGSRVGPDFLRGGQRSPYQPLAALAGAAVGAILFETLGTVLGAVALFIPGDPGLRRAAQRSTVLRELNGVVPPRRLLGVLARIDPFPALAGQAPRVAAPDPRIARFSSVRDARPSVVRVLGSACGLGVEGTGWVAASGLVVTAAHVVAGQHDTVVQVESGDRLSAVAAAFDRRDDVAVLRVAGLDARPLRLTAPHTGTAVAVLGYPENGPFTVTPARIGPTQVRLTEDAYGTGHVFRELTSLRGRVRHGNSGSPAVDRSGAVETTVFASLIGARGGLGVPSQIVARVLAAAEHTTGTVSTGPCAP